jgi:hypothetical protein
VVLAVNASNPLAAFLLPVVFAAKVEEPVLFGAVSQGRLGSDCR